MTGKHENLRDIKVLKRGSVTFLYGSQKGYQMKRNNSWIKPIPTRKCVFSLRSEANLISVNQLIDEGLMVQFTIKDCKALDRNDKNFRHRVRSNNYYYMWQKHTDFYLPNLQEGSCPLYTKSQDKRLSQIRLEVSFSSFKHFQQVWT